jgi:AAA15 family ATPase/GTPase
MKLTEFRVRPYRNVVDSGWVNVQCVTALVGQNEGGESNLCEGLM